MNDPVREHFEKLAPGYSRNFLEISSGKTYEFRKRQDIVCEFARKSTGRLLDCAIGTGEIARAVIASGGFTHATMVDISPKMLDGARSLIGSKFPSTDCRFVEADIFNFCAEEKNRFDLILCLGLVAHVGRLSELLVLLKNLLGPTGKIILQSTLANHAGIRLVRAFTEKRYQRRFGYAISYYRHEDVMKSASAAGLRVMDERRFCIGIPFADRLWARGNFLVESALDPVAARYGAEGIFVLTDALDAGNHLLKVGGHG